MSAAARSGVTGSFALGCALYFDRDLSVDSTPLESLLRSLFAEGAFAQWMTSERTQQVGSPAAFDLGILMKKVRSGTIASAAVETPNRAPDAGRRFVLVQTTPAAKVCEAVPPRSWRYDLVAAFGAASLRELGVSHVIDRLLAFAGAVRATAGVIHWTDTAEYATGLAMCAGGGLTPAEEARVVDSCDWRTDWGRIIRGPSWGTFLSPRHVDHLGGIEHVERNSGCARVVRLTSGGAFLQLTPVEAPLVEESLSRPAGRERETPDNHTQLAALARFLVPVMGRCSRD